jgi:hypothetical protein
MGNWRLSSMHSQPWHYKEVSDQFHSPAALSPQRSPYRRSDRKMAGPQNLNECSEEKNLLLQLKIDSSVTQPVAWSLHIFNSQYKGSLYRKDPPPVMNKLLQYVVHSTEELNNVNETCSSFYSL